MVAVGRGPPPHSHSAGLHLAGWGPGGRRFKSCLPDEKGLQNAEVRDPDHWKRSSVSTAACAGVLARQSLCEPATTRSSSPAFEVQSDDGQATIYDPDEPLPIYVAASGPSGREAGRPGLAMASYAPAATAAPGPVETAAYLPVTEAVSEAAARGAGWVRVQVEERDGILAVEVQGQAGRARPNSCSRLASRCIGCMPRKR